MTRIAFLLPSLKFGGAERVALNLAAALKARGYAVDILVMQTVGELLGEAARDFTVVDLGCRRTWQLPGRLAAYLRRARPAALIASFWKLNVCACLARLAAPRTRLALWEHSPPSRSVNSPVWLYGPSASLLYRLATRVVAVSQAVADDVRRITFGLSGRVIAIHNPVPPPPAGAASVRGGARLAWVGRLDQPKNPALALEAFALLPPERGYTLEFVGDGPQLASLKDTARDLGLAQVIEFAGFSFTVYERLAQSDLLVLSSDREGFGNVLAEALHAGLGVVATDCGGGVREVLGGGAWGTIVPVGDAAALAQAIAAEIAAPRDPAVQRRAAARFAPDLIAGQFLAALGLE